MPEPNDVRPRSKEGLTKLYPLLVRNLSRAKELDVFSIGLRAMFDMAVRHLMYLNNIDIERNFTRRGTN